MRAWAKSNHNNDNYCGAQRAEEILNNMQTLYNNAQKQPNNNIVVVKPNAKSYAIVIDAWARSNQKGSALLAESLLKRMQILAKTTNDPDLEPDTILFTTVLKA